MGATRPCELAVPVALLRFAQGQAPAGLNNRVAGSRTVCPAKKEQAMPAPLEISRQSQWFKEENRVTAVRYEKDGGVERVSGDQIVLSAGVYHSPKLLMLSGIGPPAEIERRGIRAVHALEGVGENLQDHSVVYLRLPR